MYPHKQFVICWDFIFGFEFVIEVYSSESAIGVDLDLLALNKLAPKGLFAILIKVKHYLVPTFVKLERHGALKRLDTCDRLVVAADKSPLHILVIKHSHLKPKVLVQLHHPYCTFLTNSTSTGMRIFIDPVLPLGKPR